MKRKLTLIISIVLLFAMLLISCEQAVSIIGASINENGELVLEMSDGTTKNIGVIKGDSAVEDNPQGLDFYLQSDGTYAVDLGKAIFLEEVNIPEQYKGKNVTKIFCANTVDRIMKDLEPLDIKLKTVIIPNTVTVITNGAFAGCSELTNITIPNSVTQIGGYAFAKCTKLTSIIIPNSVTNIGDYAFMECTSLTSVTIPDSVTSIGVSAFEGCTSLTSVNILDSVTSIGNLAFSGCSSLTSVTIGNSVTSIGDRAFQGCTSLTSVTIGNSVTSIGSYALFGCASLTSIKYRGTEAQWNNISKDYIGYNGTITYNYTGQ